MHQKVTGRNGIKVTVVISGWWDYGYFLFSCLYTFIFFKISYNEPVFLPF